MNFKDKVYEAVGKVPKRKVVSYGQVAAFCGSPRAARQVGWMLRLLKHEKPSAKTVPWWRVVNNKGVISIKGNLSSTKHLQKTLLEKEGIVVSSDFEVDMLKYRYNLLKKTNETNQ